VPSEAHSGNQALPKPGASLGKRGPVFDDLAGEPAAGCRRVVGGLRPVGSG